MTRQLNLKMKPHMFPLMNAEFALLFEMGHNNLRGVDWKSEELRRREERFLQHPNSGRTWEEVKNRARSQKITRA